MQSFPLKLKYVCLFTYKALTSDYTSDYFFKRYVILMDRSFFPPIEWVHENGGEWLHFVIILPSPQVKPSDSQPEPWYEIRFHIKKKQKRTFCFPSVSITQLNLQKRISLASQTLMNSPGIHNRWSIRVWKWFLKMCSWPRFWFFLSVRKGSYTTNGGLELYHYVDQSLAVDAILPGTHVSSEGISTHTVILNKLRAPQAIYILLWCKFAVGIEMSQLSVQLGFFSLKTNSYQAVCHTNERKYLLVE